MNVGEGTGNLIVGAAARAKLSPRERPNLPAHLVLGLDISAYHRKALSRSYLVDAGGTVQRSRSLHDKGGGGAGAYQAQSGLCVACVCVCRW